MLKEKTMCQKVAELLANHDTLREPIERENVATYLKQIFEKAWAYDALAASVTELAQRVAKQ